MTRVVLAAGRLLRGLLALAVLLGLLLGVPLLGFLLAPLKHSPPLNGCYSSVGWNFESQATMETWSHTNC